MALFSATYAFYSILTDAYTSKQHGPPLAHDFYHNWQFWLALVMGVTWSFLIFSLDQVFLSPSSARPVWVFLSRLAIALVLSKAISIPVELLLFHSKIAGKLTEDKRLAEDALTQKLDRDIDDIGNTIKARKDEQAVVASDHSLPNAATQPPPPPQSVPLPVYLKLPELPPPPARFNTADSLAYQEIKQERDRREELNRRTASDYNAALILNRQIIQINNSEQHDLRQAVSQARKNSLDDLKNQIEALDTQKAHLQKVRLDTLAAFNLRTAGIYQHNLVNSYSALDAICQPIEPEAEPFLIGQLDSAKLEARQQQLSLAKQNIEHSGNWWIVHFIWLVFIVFETSPVVYKTFFMNTDDYDEILEKRRKSATTAATTLIQSLQAELRDLDTTLVNQHRQIHRAFLEKLLAAREAGIGPLVTGFTATEHMFKNMYDQVVKEIQRRLQSGGIVPGPDNGWLDKLAMFWKFIQHPVIGSAIICLAFKAIKHWYGYLLPDVANIKTLEEAQWALCLAFSSGISIVYRNQFASSQHA